MMKSFARALCAGLLLSATVLTLPVTPAVAKETWEQKEARKMQSKAAAGDAENQLRLGTALLSGDYGLPVDAAQGVAWVTKAADAGYAKAQTELARLYEVGKYVPADAGLAIDWYEKGSASGDVDASMVLAAHFDDGTLVEKDQGQAVKWFEIAAGQGNNNAAFELGRRYDTGTGGAPLDHVKAMSWFAKTPASFDVMVGRAVCADNTTPFSTDEDWARALPYCQKLEAQADVIGIYGVGMAYAGGKGVTKDGGRAMDYLTRAATAGHAEAMGALGDVYIAGTLAPQDIGTGWVWYRKGARSGSMSAALAMARNYARGEGIAADTAAAARLYEIVERAGTPQQVAQAADWFKANPGVSVEQVRTSIVSVGALARVGARYPAKDGAPPVDFETYINTLMTFAYPSRAMDDEVEGMATMECQIALNGDFKDCVLVEETPQNYGFGRALDGIMVKLDGSTNKADWSPQMAGKTVRFIENFRLS